MILSLIIATIDDDSISNFELFDRIELTIRSSGIKDTPELRREITGKTLRMLIDEKLQHSYARKHNITVASQDIKRATSIILQNNNVSEEFDDFLQSQGVDKRSFMRQLEAQIIWQKILGSKISPFVTISDFEITQAKEQLQNSASITQVKLSEMFLLLR